jgi:CMP/dCMP kinase
MVIAIDGPAGAGKSSVAKAVAHKLGFTYLDSGAMYRCVALAALRTAPEADLTRIDLGAIAAAVKIELGTRTILNGEDVTAAIRTQEVSQNASRVASDSTVRAAMVAQQRQLMADGDWVAEGRDIGTVVKPDAELKIYLTATPQERARRRAEQSGEDYETVLTEQLQRDARDMNRADSPLKPAAGSVDLDTTGLTLEQVVDRIVALASDPGSAATA